MSRFAVLVQVANLTEVEKALLDTTIAVLTDPALEGAKRELLHGRLALRVEGDEVVWINPEELEPTLWQGVDREEVGA